MGTFGLGDAVLTSIFSMLIVFLILIILAAFLSLFKYVGRLEGGSVGMKATAKREKVSAPTPVEKTVASTDHRMVAMLTAACVAQEASGQDIRILSCEEV